MSTTEIKNLKLSLLLLRLGVFIVFFFWIIDKFVKPEHTAKVFAQFYFMGDLSTEMAYVIGAVQLLILVAFLLGIMKFFSYGIIMLMHLGSTLLSFPKYLEPFSSLLFFAAWPMLAACIALFLLRDQDTMLNIGK